MIRNIYSPGFSNAGFALSPSRFMQKTGYYIDDCGNRVFGELEGKFHDTYAEIQSHVDECDYAYIKSVLLSQDNLGDIPGVYGDASHIHDDILDVQELHDNMVAVYNGLPDAVKKKYSLKEIINFDEDDFKGFTSSLGDLLQKTEDVQPDDKNSNDPLRIIPRSTPLSEGNNPPEGGST